MTTKEITKKKKKSTRNRRLVYGRKRDKGRNNQGHITVRHRGGGHKRLYRLVDFRRPLGKAKVIKIERDPNRSAKIALVKYEEHGLKYVLACDKLRKGQILDTNEKASLKPGNRLKLKNIIPGTDIFNIELKAGQGGKMVRSAGNAAQVKAIEGKAALISLPSGEIRLTSAECYATVGSLSNPGHSGKKLRKAGQKRHLGRRPKVRGVAMHPGAHPHGGGEGRSSVGMKYPKSPTGKHSKGKKTRKAKKYSDRLIIKRAQKRGRK